MCDLSDKTSFVVIFIPWSPASSAIAADWSVNSLDTERVLSFPWRVVAGPHEVGPTQVFLQALHGARPIHLTHVPTTESRHFFTEAFQEPADAELPTQIFSLHFSK